MSDARAKDLIDLGARLFESRASLMTLMQEVAENFYPERGYFTSHRSIGDDLYADLMDSYPPLMRRELGNLISSMLRPRDSQWFRATTGSVELDADTDNARFLEYISKTMSGALYDNRSRMVNATKAADHDFVTFGQAVLSVEESPTRDYLIYRNYHIKDCAWLESEAGEIDHLHRDMSMTARKMRQRFGDSVLHATVKKAAEKEPHKEFNVRVVVMPSDEYDYSLKGGKPAGKRLPYVCCYVDTANAKVLKEAPMSAFPYIVPRWSLIGDGPYAYSPCTTVALPDGRQLQSLARIIVEAGEKSVDPPLVGVEEAVREVNIAAGGVSWVDYAYDERLGEALRPLNITGDMRTAFAMRSELRESLTKAFFLDKLTLPPSSNGQMTAYEVQQRLEEFVRGALPLFEPMEVEYNSRLLDKTFTLQRNMNAFDWSRMPDSLSDSDINWSFESPLKQAANRMLVAQFGETLQILGMAQQAGVQSSPVYLDKAVADALRGIGGPATWRKSKVEVEAEAEAAAAAAAIPAAMAEIDGAAQTVGNVADVTGKIRDAMAPAEGEPMPPPRPRRNLGPQPIRRNAA